MKRQLKKIIPVLLLATACANNTQEASNSQDVSAMNSLSDNPFMEPSPLFMNYPQFDKIKNDHFGPALTLGMEKQLAEVAAIANSTDRATFENTMVALEKSGQLLDRAGRVFFALVSANTNDDLAALRQEMAPKFAAHSDEILLNASLFQRVKSLYDQRDNLGLEADQERLLVENYKDFVRAGAELSDKDKEALRAINSEIATLQAAFNQKVLDEVNSKAIVVDSKEELDGLSEAQIGAAAEAAKARDLDGKYVLPLLNTSGQPSMASLHNRALRERIHKTSVGRGSSGGEHDTREVLVKIVALREKKAELLGFENHAAQSLQSQTAQTTAAVNKRLATLAPAAVANARNEAKALQAMMDAENKGKSPMKLEAWDWAYYTEKVRAERYDFDALQLKPYLEMDSVLQNGVFYAAEKVFGLTFKERKDLPVYHPDVKVWEVFNEDGSTLALFIQDFYARESKRGGAWMNSYVLQSDLMGGKPVVGNHLNIPKPPVGEPTLLT